MSRKSNSLFSISILTGLLAGTLDILAAVLNYLVKGGENPKIILNYIASAVFGEKAYNEGILMPALGLFFHYLVAFGWTLLFFCAYSRLEILSMNKYINGIVYGIFIWVVMNLVVLPLSRAPGPPFDMMQSLISMGILAVAIGLPISLMASRYYEKDRPNLN